MQDDDKLYGLIAQAEDIQKHAVTLERAAQEAIKGLPEGYREAIKGAAKEILTEAAEKASTALLGACNEAKVTCVLLKSTGLFQGVFLLAVGVVVSVIAVAGIWWGTSSLRDESAELRTSIAAMKGTAAQLESKMWGLELVNYGDGTRGIVLPKGVKIDSTGVLPDGRAGVVIKP